MEKRAAYLDYESHGDALKVWLYYNEKGAELQSKQTRLTKDICRFFIMFEPDQETKEAASSMDKKEIQRIEDGIEKADKFLTSFLNKAMKVMLNNEMLKEYEQKNVQEKSF